MAKITIIYSLLSHSGSVTQGNTIEEANALNQRAQVIPGRFADGRRIVTVDSPAVQIDAVKKAEDDGAIVVCIHECRGSQTKFTLPCAPNTRWGRLYPAICWSMQRARKSSDPQFPMHLIHLKFEHTN